MGIKVLLADDHQVIRQGLRALLERQDDIQIVGEAEDGRIAVKLAGELSPDIVIMDVAMPELNGVEAARQITAAMPEVKVIALSMHRDRRFLSEMLAAGAAGYLLKTCDLEELVAAIHAVNNNQTYLSPHIAGDIVAEYVRHVPQEDHSSTCMLSAREREVLQLVAEGHSTKEIASHLHVSVKTADAHRQRIMNKLAVRSVAELTKYAIREGLTSIE